MKLPSFMFGVLALALVVSLLCVWLYPSVQDFMAANSMWNGIKKFGAEVGAESIDSLDELPDLSQGKTLVLIPYIQPSEEELLKVRRFVDGGGTLLLMDDYGYGNSVLTYLGLAAQFTRKPLLDPLFCYRNQRMPRITDFSPQIKESGIRVLVLNHATTLSDVSGPEIIAWSSGTSFLDVDENGEKGQDEPGGPFPVAARLRAGQGSIVIVADPSIVINSMLGRDDNHLFIDNLIRAEDGVLIARSHLVKAPLDTSKVRLAEARQVLSSPYALVGIMALIFALVSGYTLRRRENIG